MKRRNFLHLVAVSTVFVMPAINPMASAMPQDDRDDKRDEKKEQKDNKKAEHAEHKWTKAEDKYYRQYLDDKHEKYRDYNKLNHEDQERYWEWRDSHRDDDHDRDDYGR